MVTLPAEAELLAAGPDGEVERERLAPNWKASVSETDRARRVLFNFAHARRHRSLQRPSG